MDWIEETTQKYRRGNSILFPKDSPLLQPLADLIAHQSHRTLILWALDLSEEVVLQLESHCPGQARPRQALTAAREWAAGTVKMCSARRAILGCHALARELTDRSDIALCHAVGQGCSTVHTPRHALGLPMYELTALVHQYGLLSCTGPVEERVGDYMEKLLFRSLNPVSTSWASFIHG